MTELSNLKLPPFVFNVTLDIVMLYILYISRMLIQHNNANLVNHLA